MQKLEQDHQNERENSLFASLELSLQRLSAESRELVKSLAILHDGGNRSLISNILETEDEAVAQLGVELIQVGLAEAKDYSYLRLDPALPDYLRLQWQNQQEDYLQLEQRWSKVMSQLVDFLYQQHFKDEKLAAKLTSLELPNLMAFIRYLNQQLQAKEISAETVMGNAGRIEQLLATLNYPQALAEIISIGQQATEQLGEWGEAHFDTKRLTINRLLTQGDLQQAQTLAEKLLQQCQQAGAEAYTRADYDLAMANYLLGQILRTGGAATEAFAYLQQAQQRFEVLGEQGATMASVSLTEQGGCLLDLGQLEQAATTYQEVIKRAEKQDAIRSIAIGKTQLALVRLEQNDYPAAQQGHHEALKLFQQLNDLPKVAAAWHGIGNVYSQKKQFKQADSAFRQSLFMQTQLDNPQGEALLLGDLGLLYHDWNRLEQAVDYYRQAITIYTQLENKVGEARQCSNLARTLIQLNRLDEARPELLYAIWCKQSWGHIAQPWKSWSILHALEQADNNPQAAEQAREKAIQTYLAYRRDGGENHDSVGRMALGVLQAIQQGETTEIKQVIDQYIEQDLSQEIKTFLHNLQAILIGERDPALAEDNEMDFDGVVELKILLEQLQAIEA